MHHQNRKIGPVKCIVAWYLSKTSHGSLVWEGGGREEDGRRKKIVEFHVSDVCYRHNSKYSLQLTSASDILKEMYQNRATWQCLARSCQVWPLVLVVSAIRCCATRVISKPSSHSRTWLRHLQHAYPRRCMMCVWWPGQCASGSWIHPTTLTFSVQVRRFIIQFSVYVVKTIVCASAFYR